MEARFAPYDIVSVKGRSDIRSAVVLDYTYGGSGPEPGDPVPIYTLYAEDGRLLEERESSLEKIGRLEPPLHHGEIVEIHPKARRYAALDGREGVVAGASWSYETGEWGFAVTLEPRNVWFFTFDELTGTGRIQVLTEASAEVGDEPVSAIHELIPDRGSTSMENDQ
ncbi:MAG TPA: hypothetical protein VKT77_16455 [Chthonomonadaceae bacterium]|nr:hypothetical protein [Chthonomonadaceae bacterium]